MAGNAGDMAINQTNGEGYIYNGGAWKLITHA
jgi:hypothetical protein